MLVMFMKMYGSVEELNTATEKAVKDYKELMGASLGIYLCKSMRDVGIEFANKARGVFVDGLGIDPAEYGKNPVTLGTTPDPSNRLKYIAHTLYDKVQEYRQESPESVVVIVEPGLSFLEQECQKHF